MGVSIDWYSQDLQDALGRIASQMPARLESALTDACLMIEFEAKDRCPADTGELRRSIAYDVRKLDDNNVIEGIVGTNMSYAPYVHEGTGLYAHNGRGRKQVPWCYWDEARQELIWTKGQKPQPFLEDAVNAKAGEIVNYFNNILGEE